MLCITNNSIKHQSFVYTHLNDQTLLFQIIQFSISHLFGHNLNVKQFYLTHRSDPIRCYHSWPEWTWEQWQWKGTLHSCSLTIRLFSVISRTLVVGLGRERSYPTAEKQSVYSTNQPTGSSKVRLDIHRTQNSKTNLLYLFSF